MNILYVAFPCNPYVGSESKIGWNIPIESAKSGNIVSVVTIKDMKKDIDDYFKKNGLEKIRFYYVDIPKFFKKALKNFSTLKLKLYHVLILRKIKRIIIDGKKINLIHQITPVEFRSIGNYYKIKDVRFVVGPVGGGEYIPNSLKEYEKNQFIIEKIRKTLNSFEKLKLRINEKKIKNTKILFANEETMNYLNEKNGTIMTEVGILPQEINGIDNLNKNNHTVFIVSGRLIYRKGHELLLNVLKTIPNDLKYRVRIIGDGKELKNIKEKINNNEKLKMHIDLLGKVEYSTMKNEYSKADVLIMPSLRETTGSVILEAMGNGLPVIAMNKFGARLIVNNSNGYLYDGKNKQELENSLKKCIISCINNKGELEIKKKKAIEDSIKYTFENKMKEYNLIYRDLLKNNMEENK